jgi:hypothetical protein
LTGLETYFSFACLAILATICLIAFLRVRFNMMVFLSYNLSLVYVGLCLLAYDGVTTWLIAHQYGLGLLGLIAGYWLAVRHFKRQSFLPSELALGRAFPDSSIAAVVIVSGILGIYHLVASGIPVFSSSIEVERFDFTSSGLFGIPGRMYLFGIPIAWMAASVNAHALGISWKDYPPWRWATGFYIVASLLSGFKSGMLAMLFTMLIVYFLIRPTAVPLGQFVKRYWWIVLIPAAYGLAVATTYSSYQGANIPLWRQLLDRLTVVGAQPAQFALEERPRWYLPNGFWNDLGYYLSKYTGGEISFTYSFERAISAEIIGVDPSSSAWTTPVTIGGFAELTYSAGLAVAVACMALAGCWVAFVHHSPPRSPGVLLMSAVFAYGLYNWLLKGGLVYFVVNLGAVVGMLAIVASLGLLGRKNHTPLAPPPEPALPRQSMAPLSSKPRPVGFTLEAKVGTESRDKSVYTIHPTHQNGKVSRRG